jgi:hypothetical protein
LKATKFERKIRLGAELWQNDRRFKLNKTVFLILAGGRSKRLAPLTDDCPTLWFEKDGNIPMIEIYSSGLLWQLMQDCPYIASGLKRAGFGGVGTNPVLRSMMPDQSITAKFTRQSGISCDPN